MKKLVIGISIVILAVVIGLALSDNSEYTVSVEAEKKYQDFDKEETVVLEEVRVTEEVYNNSIDMKLKDREIQNKVATDELKKDERKALKKENTIGKDNTSNGSRSSYDSSKKVFLTFDDGPTALTPEVLKILEMNDVKATFFVIGKLAEKNPEIIKETYLSGHAILTHSYSHDYAIYSTFETFYEDFYRAEKILGDTLDIEVPSIFRFPGGSSNQSSFKYGGQQFMPKLTEDIKEKGYYYIDWNVSSGDASPDYNDGQKMLNNVLKGAESKNFVVVLFHDVQKNTKVIDILPEVINSFKERGYMFRSFRDITEEELNKMIDLKLANKPIIR